MSDRLAFRSRRAGFGRRRIAPHVCLVAGKPHLRSFLAETFTELGFVAHACDDDASLAVAHDAIPLDLVAIVLAQDDPARVATLRVLAAGGFDGLVMLIGGRGAGGLEAAQRLGERLGLFMLPMLGTPFRIRELADRVAAIRPAGPPPAAPVDVAEALGNGWLELWYQPRVDPRSRLTRGAQALCRLRHPAWGIVTPSCFVGDGAHLRDLAKFVVQRAIRDWLYFAESAPVEIALHVPLTGLASAEILALLRRRLPRHGAGLVVEIDGAEAARDLALAHAVATRLGLFGIGVSIDAGADGLLPNLAFTALRVDPQFVRGCAKDGLKAALCGSIVDFARRFGVRTVAAGAETRADLIALRELGFDLVQGALFGAAMEPRKFARTLLDRVDVLQPAATVPWDSPD